ncbi:unnamed protein product [Candida verbasci]|uniref:25S rRNA adenine-N(1) methyltransferase n=1 Tax=Candida verbasci TaxID=1227364 RepID=A0A9W4TSY2_9ASCO|nr:unnamed protein product [Candida verbasci]
MPIKKKSSILSHKTKSITGKSNSVPKSLKPQQTRQIIRRFHVLQKNKYSILTKLRKIYPEINIDNYKELIHGKIYQNSFNIFQIPAKYSDNKIYKIDETLSITQLIEILAKIDSEIEQRGGIETYQSASTQGQTNKRGGDSSKKLIEWLRDEKYEDKLNNLTALEIGCLSPSNAITTCGIFKEITRIDLNSQDPLIIEQDFMKRPLPTAPNEKYNLISCSLVVNFVPLPKERGEMLIRITKFLKKATKDSLSCLFFVLPLPCITNSRYFDNDKLLEIMKSLGFTQSFSYEANKVAYWLFDWNGKITNKKFNKKELHSGSSRNNFCITIH